MKLSERILKFWYFHFANPVIWMSEKGGFRVKIRRFWIDYETLSGNFRARWMADKYPYGYLVSAINTENEVTIWGFIERVYMQSMLMLQDKGLANDLDKALTKYEKRLEKIENDGETGAEEEIALEDVKRLQEYIELPKNERRKMRRDIDKRFNKRLEELKKRK